MYIIRSRASREEYAMYSASVLSENKSRLGARNDFGFAGAEQYGAVL